MKLKLDNMMLSNVRRKIPIRTRGHNNSNHIIPRRKIKVAIHPKIPSNNMSIYDLTRYALRHKIMVKGTYGELLSTVRQVQDSIANRKKYKIMANVYLRAFLYKIGNGHASQNCQNDSDFVTGQPIQKISPVFIYCLQEGSSWYGFDIRSFHEYYLHHDHKFVNPYTFEPINNRDVVKMMRKIKWLDRLKFPIGHHQVELNEKDHFRLKVVSIFQQLSQLGFYVDYNWFNELDLRMLKQLYYEIADIWDYRLDISRAQKRLVVRNGVVFAEYNSIKNYDDRFELLLRKKILRGLERLITEGDTLDNRKLGGYYFMLGFVQISEAAADSNPALFIAAHNVHD
jgi:hypothetical protein